MSGLEITGRRWFCLVTLLALPLALPLQGCSSSSEEEENGGGGGTGDDCPQTLRALLKAATDGVGNTVDTSTFGDRCLHIADGTITANISFPGGGSCETDSGTITTASVTMEGGLIQRFNGDACDYSDVIHDSASENCTTVIVCGGETLEYFISSNADEWIARYGPCDQVEFDLGAVTAQPPAGDDSDDDSSDDSADDGTTDEGETADEECPEDDGDADGEDDGDGGGDQAAACSEDGSDELIGDVYKDFTAGDNDFEDEVDILFFVRNGCFYCSENIEGSTADQQNQTLSRDGTWTSSFSEELDENGDPIVIIDLGAGTQYEAYHDIFTVDDYDVKFFLSITPRVTYFFDDDHNYSCVDD